MRPDARNSTGSTKPSHFSHTLAAPRCGSTSFVTAKDDPGDFDAVWDSDGINEDILDPLFYDLADGRIRQKLRFRGELFPNWVNSTSDSPFSDFFQQDRHGRPKGIVVIDPREVTQ
jgi:hypothetical protein